MKKKRLAIIIAATMITGSMAGAVMAEEVQSAGAPQMGTPQMSAPQMPGGEAPQMNSGNGQQAPQGEMPQMSGNGPQMRGNGPQMGNRGPRMDGRGQKEDGGRISFDNLVKDGTISQETYDAISKYMNEHKPEIASGEEGSSEAKPEMKKGNHPDLLDDLLADGVITQEEYDALSAAREAQKSGNAAGTQKTAETQKAAETQNAESEGAA